MHTATNMDYGKKMLNNKKIYKLEKYSMILNYRIFFFISFILLESILLSTYQNVREEELERNSIEEKIEESVEKIQFI